MRHGYFKSYLQQLFENNSNKCYEICTARQTSKHLLLNCKHYRREQIKLKKKAQLKNTDTILTLFIIKINRSATLKYLKHSNCNLKMIIRNEKLGCEDREKMRLIISKQNKTINHSLTYIQKACNESIENSIQRQINLLQSQTNSKLETILQLMQQNAQKIKKRIKMRQVAKSSQILQFMKMLQMS